MLYATCYMLFNVPQFIDIEDKIVGPLTARQLGWLALGSIITLILYGLLDKSSFVFSVIIVAIIFGGLAFYRPYNQPLIKFITSSIMFATRPKMYVWKREVIKETKRESSSQGLATTITKKSFDSKKAESISQILDKK